MVNPHGSGDRALHHIHERGASRPFSGATSDVFGHARWFFIVLADLRKAQKLDAEQRRSTVEFWKEISPLIEGRFIALAYVIDNALIRGTIQAVSWFQKPPAPMRTVSTIDEAKARLA
ncbi:MAG: hypothetical protein GY822_08160 [Deltaproteobacteria bacterium]|nr:hypothetical protein [Deltaproteobacteria bacterium]